MREPEQVCPSIRARMERIEQYLSMAEGALESLLESGELEGLAKKGTGYCCNDVNSARVQLDIARGRG